MFFSKSIVIISLTSLIASTLHQVDATEPVCDTMEAIFGNGTALVEGLWGGAFRVVPVGDPEYENAYTWWHFKQTNPNLDVSARRIAEGLHDEHSHSSDECHVAFFHVEGPPVVENGFSECHPYRDSACCKPATVASADVINAAYGDGFAFDRCGKMSDECARFFIHEACYYECDASAGLFLKTPPEIFNATNATERERLGYNSWELEGVPVQEEYANAFYDACSTQLFGTCGSFFECAPIYEKFDENARNDDEPLSGFIVALIIVLGAMVILISLGTYNLISKERAGEPMFKKLDTDETASSEVFVKEDNCL